MNERKNAMQPFHETDLEYSKAEDISPEEYEELPELTEEMIRRSTLMDGEQEIYSFPKELITLPLSADTFERWVATGPGWYARMAERLRNI
jgi:uncharacterized protein (DUF4415 family)